MKYPNIFENLKEAQFRLIHTVVMYDGVPFLVLAIADHNKDDAFRIYLEPIDWENPSMTRPRPETSHLMPDGSGHGPVFDRWLETAEGKNSGVIRKKMDSPYFNRFRPFPLGMCNFGSRTYYMEWTPARIHHQGLTTQHIIENTVSAKHPFRESRLNDVPMYSPAFHACITGQHPTPQEALANLKDAKVENDAFAFHRHFAILRGPVNTFFLAYKYNVIGSLANGDFSEVHIAPDFHYAKEVTAELALFNRVVAL